MNDPLIIIKQGIGDASTAGGSAMMFRRGPVGPSAHQSGVPISHVRNVLPIHERNMNMKKTLGTDDPIKLVLCDCGKLHVTCGPVTLHFTRDEFLAYADSVRRLAAIIAQPSTSLVLSSAQASPMEVCH